MAFKTIIMKLDLIEFDREVLNKSFEWLNDPEIKFLISTPDVTKQSQNDWFESLAYRNDYKVYGIRLNGEDAIGVMGFKRINFDEGISEYFGYIGNKSFWGKGIGNWMLDSAIKIAEDLKLGKIYLDVLCSNYVAINLYFKKGFKIVSFENNTYKMDRKIQHTL
jgi:RimJ/RimL family protein N-acetyltransferase